MTPELHPWYEKYPGRFAEERKILEGSGFTLNTAFFEEKQTVMFEGSLSVDPARRLQVVYTEAFPSLPPRVFDAPEAELLRRHHEPTTRQLCLFGVSNARWNAECTAREVLQEATELIQTFGIGGTAIADDVVPEPVSATLPYQLGESIFIPPNISEFTPVGTERIKGDVVFMFTPKNRFFGSGRGIAISAAIGKERFDAKQNYIELLGQGPQKLTATLVYLPTTPNREGLKVAIDDCLKADIFGKRKRTRWIALVFPEHSGSTMQVRNSWVFARVNELGQIQLIRTFPYRPDERIARTPSLHGLRGKSVAFVGCGCLGSKIAVNLAASGVTDFALVDEDVMEPYNAVRHELGADSFGLVKVEALSRRLQQINPEVSSQNLPICIGAPNLPSDEKRIYEALSRASLIVDTTGSHGVSRWVNDISSDHNIPAIFVSVTNGAWGGEIVRSVPGKTACWMCWNDQYCNSQPPAEHSTGFFAPGCNQPSFTGTTYDTGMVACLASSMITDTLLTNGHDESSYKGDYIRWSARDESGPILKAEILPVNKRSDCPFCRAR